MAASRFAENDAEAEERANRWAVEDPFPNIPPALLNSRDIADYVAATGMLYPFHETEDKLKPASYEVDLLGRCVSWDETGQPFDEVIVKGIPLVLKANSITFVTVEPMFRLPPYLALRFNLRITQVYRGLLLGTGPLIDPGFHGALSIPLHNLTTNDYTIYGGEGLIWMEFTKLSPDPNISGAKRPPRRSGRVVPLPAAKRSGLDVMDYLRKAEPQLPLKDRRIRSGIPKATQEASDAARDARDKTAEAEQAIATIRERIRVGTVVGALTLVIAVGGLVAAFWQLLSQTQTRLDSVVPAERVTQLQSDVARLERQVQQLRSTARPSPSAARPTPAPRPT